MADRDGPDPRFIMIPRRVTIVRYIVRSLVLSAALCMAVGCSKEGAQPSESRADTGKSEAPAVSTAGGAHPYPESFTHLPVWDQGLSEMSYYQAVDTIYGQPRRYVRVMLLNREWLNPLERVKSNNPKAAAQGKDGKAAGNEIPVLKLNLIEEIPTQNYNYRYMVTTFLNRESLEPEKVAASSQEWCGTTFKQYQWLPDGLKVRGFSYFEGEGDREWSLPKRPVVYPAAALFVIARALVAADRNMTLHVLPPARSTHMSEPIPQEVSLEVSKESRSVRVPFGRFSARIVTATRAGESKPAEFTIEAAAPYRLLAYRGPTGLELSLRFQENRAYWDRSKPSRFYRQGAAP